MEITHRLAITLFLSLSLLLVAGCNQESQPQAIPSQPTHSTASYNNNGLSLEYPKHWALAYNDTPDIYATRAVGFQVSELSTARVLIEQDGSVSSADLADRFEQELQLTTGEFVGDYRRTPIKIADFSGERLSWTDNFVGAAKVEMIVIQITEKPAAVFAVFNFGDDDIAQEAKYIEPFVKSISFK